MVSLRSRRLESVFGATLDDLTADQVRGLVTSNVQEAFDLDFKEALYGRGDADKRSLAGDVAALANTAGGVIVLGIEEDEQARATAAPGVAVTDDEVRRIRQVVASLVAPLPVFDILTVFDPAEVSSEPEADDEPTSPRDGFIVIAVPRSPSGPHAVLVNDGLRYPKRNGATTRYLSEPEVATAYRDRLTSAARQAERAEKVEEEGLAGLDTSDGPWVVVTLVPDLAGDMSLSQEMHRSFQQQVIGQQSTIIPNGTAIRRVRVGRRRLLADGTMDNSPLARWISLDLHTDGAGTYAVRVADLAEQQRQMLPTRTDEPLVQLIDDESIAMGILSGLSYLARHARDRAAAGGAVVVRARLAGISPERPAHIGHTRSFGGTRSTHAHKLNPDAAEAAAALDDLAEPGLALVATAALLHDELGQAFGIPEMGQLTRDGKLRQSFWAHPNTRIVAWAKEYGIEVSDETLA